MRKKSKIFGRSLGARRGYVDALLTSELAHGAGDRFVQAHIQRLEFLDGDGRSLLDGDLRNRLAHVAVVLNNLTDGEPPTEQASAMDSAARASLHLHRHQEL